ncbi:hypothetical protein [Halovenus sp. HT40]|uniref:hypothetical protein n=1 Tax=Halovenus sp. HT40 TaxID=3126691 RepID=UPI00300F1129
MPTEQQSGTELETHLRRALKTAENSETKYELREALQKCYGDRSAKVDSTAAFDD